MRPAARYYLKAARVPADRYPPGTFGLWTIERQPTPDHPDFAHHYECQGVRFPEITVLRCASAATLHLEAGEVVMEDSARELARHLPIFLAARGRVLVTGLGLGCVVRGLLANPQVEHIECIEIDPHICNLVGPEFQFEKRVTLHLADALEWMPMPGVRYDFAWHDLWTDDRDDGLSLNRLHLRLLDRFRFIAERQGAWAFPNQFSRLLPWSLINAPRHKPVRTRAPFEFTRRVARHFEASM